MAKNRRKTESVDDDADLCVFGFEVKLFNQAESINKEGPYMIHLPYDDDVEVDRYDCRLLLHSSKEMGELQPKSDVPDFEEDYLCEEERYLDLKNLEVKDKPSPQINNTGVPFTYEKQSPSPPAVNPVTEEPFHQIYPSGMILPSTKKQALLIEKTAKFVVEKGADYETSISSKASSNKNLYFLLPGDPLNGYYKYVVSLMKDKIYILIPEHQEEENASESDEEYLNPLLMRKRKQHPEPSAAPKPKKAGNFSIFYKSNENDIIQPKLYFEWYERFYNGPSPYYPNILPKIIKPPEQLAAGIRTQAEQVAKNGREQEKVFTNSDASGSKHMQFTNPYYMFYQQYLFKRAVEIEEANKEQERQKAAQEEGEIIEEALGDSADVEEEELQRQMERRQKAHLFLNTILSQKRNQSTVEIEDAIKEQERQKAAQEEGEIIEEALGDSADVEEEEELQRQMERRQKAHLFLKTILSQKRKQSTEDKKDG
uniref:SURP motif domain-containing protein n=1 Tax=Panagrolaimus sp. PS1159 TaxID=55785 RepID=A0AC35ETN8_9BILA